MTKAFALNDERFINGNKYDTKYFDELLERIKAIRVSERMSYQKIIDLFIATATYYNSKSEEAYTFFKIVYLIKKQLKRLKKNMKNLE